MTRDVSVNNSANTFDLDWLAALEAELVDIKSVLEKLQGDIEKQCSLIEAEDATGIKALLEVRAGVIESIEKASERAAPWVEAFARDCEQIEPGRVAELQALLDTIGRSLQSVLDSDRQAEVSIGKAMAGIQERITQTRTTSAATHAYHGHGAATPEARFSDRKA